MTDLIISNIMHIILGIPCIGALLSIALRRLCDPKILAISSTALIFILTLLIWINFDLETHALQYATSYSWISILGIKYITGIDGLNLPFLFLISLFFPLTILLNWNNHLSNNLRYISMFLLLETSLIGAFISFDMTSFYFFSEIALVCLFFTIAYKGGSTKTRETFRFLLISSFGSILILTAIAALYQSQFETLGFKSKTSLGFYGLKEIPFNHELIFFIAFSLGLYIKSLLWPLHNLWSQNNQPAANYSIIILLSIYTKLGIYGFIRFIIPMFPNAFAALSPYILFLGVLCFFIGLILAYTQPNLIKLVTSIALSHNGVAIIGAAMLSRSSFPLQAITGSFLHLINSSIAVFACLLAIHLSPHHFNGFNDSKLSRFLLLTFICGLMMFPGSGSFSSIIFVLYGAIETHPLTFTFLVMGLALGINLTRSTYLKFNLAIRTQVKNESKYVVTIYDFFAFIPIGILIVLLGVNPQILVSQCKTSIEYFAQYYDNYELEFKNQNHTN